MPDLSASSSGNVSSMQRWHSLKNMGGCMSGFSQMLRLTKMLGGSTSNYRPTSAARAQSSENQTQSPSIGQPNTARAERMQGAEVVIDLRRILDARQEPFVLQDIIWEKRHPVRTQSSRELKFDFNEIKFPSEKAQSSKRRSSKDKRRHSNGGFDGVVPETPQKNGMASSVLVKGNSIPAENIIILPSSQATIYVRKTISSSQKMSIGAKSPVKSPSKKALLMEAAARILEGSNRQTCRRSSSSARSLLRELDESKQAQGRSASKEPVINKESMVDECAIEGTSMTSPEENRADGKTFTHIDVNNCFSFLDRCQQDLPGSLNDDFEKIDEEVMGTMQGRIYPSDGMPTESELLMDLAAVPETPQQPILVQEPDSQFTSRSEMRHKTLKTLADASTEGTHWHLGQRQSDDQTLQGAEPIIVSEIAVEHQRQCDKDTSKGVTRDIELTLYEDQCNNTSVGEGPFQQLVDSCKPPEYYQMEIAKQFYEVAWFEKTTVDAVECTNDAASNECIETRIESKNNADALDSSDIFRDEAIDLFEGNGGKQVFCRERSDMPDAMEKATTPILLLCNFSWWTQGNIQLPSIAPKDETLYECAGYDSRDASYEDQSAVKIFEDSKGDKNDEDGSPASPDHSCVEEFQQSSPVSVLDAVYDDDSSLGKPFDYFEEARQKLLESVRRYEMLMHMDIDALITMNKENLCHEYEDESDSPSHEESWGSDSHDIFANDNPSAVINSANDRLSKYSCPRDDKGENLECNRAIGHEAIEDDLDSCSNEGLYIKMLAEKDSRGKSDFGVAAKARLIAERESSRRCKAFLDCSSEPSDSAAAALEGLRCASTSLNNCFRETSAEIETGSVCINAILQTDLKTRNWSNFNEEMEALEKELEISLFKALMQELLSELQCQGSNGAHVCPTPG